jgi:hypothetical protein
LLRRPEFSAPYRLVIVTSRSYKVLCSYSSDPASVVCALIDLRIENATSPPKRRALPLLLTGFWPRNAVDGTLFENPFPARKQTFLRGYQFAFSRSGSGQIDKFAASLRLSKNGGRFEHNGQKTSLLGRLWSNAIRFTAIFDLTLHLRARSGRQALPPTLAERSVFPLRSGPGLAAGGHPPPPPPLRADELGVGGSGRPLHQLRQRLGDPFCPWAAPHFARHLFGGLQGDGRLKGDTILVT